MRTVIIFLFAFSMITNLNAQTNGNQKKNLLNLLESKREYEKTLSKGIKAKQGPNKTKYLKTFAELKENKSSVLSYINKSLIDDVKMLSKKTVWYNYQRPESSNFDPKNRISLLTYFKIVKHSLENSKDTLPPLSEISLK